MTRKPKASSDKNKKNPKPGKVTVSRLPLVKCREPGCGWSRAILPGQNASKLLTGHYQEKHV
jgi:hypothetical protein